MNALDKALGLLPPKLRCDAEKIGGELEELRLRAGLPLAAVYDGGRNREGRETVSRGDIMYVLERATDASMHSAAQNLKNGFISCGGLRIGVCGEAVYSAGEMQGYRSYSSLNIRIPHGFQGDCGEILSTVCAGGIKNTIIISSPGMGKTTLLRELIKEISERGTRTGVIDERNELLCAAGGEAGFYLGRNSDVITMLPKRESALILLRGMNPQLIAMDEVSRKEDAGLISEINGCGVNIIATAHAGDEQDMLRRDVYRALLRRGIFELAVVIQIQDGKRRYKTVRLRE